MPTSNQSAAAPRAVNPDLKAVHTRLVEIARELDSAVGQAKTEAEVDALLNEISEVSSRVVAVGRQLFKQQTDQISRLSKDVLDGTAAAQKSIAQLDNVKGFILGMTRFLTLVDNVVDQAKLIL